MIASPTPQTRGVALVITLFFIAIITIVVLGLLDSSRIERFSSSSHFERLRATNLARHGIEETIATLQRETSNPERNWISQPGGLTVPLPTATDQQILRTTRALSSGPPTADDPNVPRDPILGPAELNVQTLTDQSPPTYLINNPLPGNTAQPMRLRWIYVRQQPFASTLPDGTTATSNYDYSETPSLGDTGNPIVGRFAYWADDESAKVNYNLAWTRNAANTFPAGHQTKVNLTALPTGYSSGGTASYFTEAMANKVHSAITPDRKYALAAQLRFFNSPFDVRQLGINDTALRDALDVNRFNLTHFNSDPDTTYYGKSRMMLTTQINNAVVRDKDGKPLRDGTKPITRPFLDILKRTDDSDTTIAAYLEPGLQSNIDGTKLDAVIKDLVNNYLKRSDWPMVDGTGHSIQEKYYANYTGVARDQRLAQLALNIIDYVRSAESKLTIVEPIRGIWRGSDFIADFVDGTIRGQPDTFKGITRGMYITEMGFWVSSKAETSGLNAGRYPGYSITEVHLPENYGIDSLDLTNTNGQRWKLYIAAVTAGVVRDSNGKAVSGNYYDRNGSIINSNENYVDYWPNLASPTASPIFIYEALTDASKKTIKAGEYRTLMMEFWSAKSPAQLGTVQLRNAFSLVGTGVRIDVAPLATPITATPSSSEVFGFPIQSYETNDPRVNGVIRAWTAVNQSTFGAVNDMQRISVGQSPSGDIPRQDTNANGKVTKAAMRMPYPMGHSSNPTGRVRSPGELGLIHTGIEGSETAPSGGVPWRSLHLQPSTQSTSVVPDWAFMDLFTVPVDVPQAAAVLFAPHNTSTGGRVNLNAKPLPFEFDRLDPLVAVLLGARVSSANTNTLNITQAQEIARNIYQRTRAANGKIYPASAAIDVYESPGEIAEIKGVADGGEESEELVREIANLVTARGNVFSVYTVGQALKQAPGGKLIVTAEQRQQAFVERYLDNRGTATDTDDEIRARMVFFRNLSP